MVEDMTVGYRELTPSRVLRASEEKLNAKTEQVIRLIGKDYSDPIAVITKPNGEKVTVWTAPGDAQELYDAAKLARDYNKLNPTTPIKLNIYDSKGNKVGELDPEDVIKKLEGWHSKLKR